MTQEKESTTSKIEQILDLARWSPSGDNTQPWRFEIKEPDAIVVHGHDTRDHCVYDLQGHASQLAIGGLLETITIAASADGLATTINRRKDMPDDHPTFDVNLNVDSDITPDILHQYISERTVQRRSMKMRALTFKEQTELEAAIPPGFRVLWLVGLTGRGKATHLTWKSAGLRLNLPEAYSVHRDVIEWDNEWYSEDRIPARAVGLDPLTLRLSRWVMERWQRVKLMNRYLGGTILPRIELELLPGIRCASHFVLISEHRPRNVDDFVAAGRAMQRFWLTAARLGLFLQPEMTPLIFHEYVQDKIHFSKDEEMESRAVAVSKSLQNLIGSNESQRAVFMGRIGASHPPRARSTRLPLDQLVKRKE